MKRNLATSLAAILALSLAWLGGYDFNERGEGAVLAALGTLIVSGFIYFAPWWD